MLNRDDVCVSLDVLWKKYPAWVEFVSSFCAALEEWGCPDEGMFDVKCILD